MRRMTAVSVFSLHHRPSAPRTAVAFLRNFLVGKLEGVSGHRIIGQLKRHGAPVLKRDNRVLDDISSDPAVIFLT